MLDGKEKTDSGGNVCWVVATDCGGTSEYRYSEVSLDSFVHHSKKHIPKVT